MTVARRRGLQLAAATWFLVVAWCTLRPDPAAVARVAALPWYCVACGDGGVTDILLNLLLFMPFGVIARVAGRRALPTLVLLCGLSTAIEFIQGHFLVGRDASLGDVLCNTLGTGLGWLAWPLIGRIARPDRRFAHFAAVGTLGISAAIWLGTGFALRPAIAGPAPWFGQWNHPWPAHELFQGSIQRGALDGLNVPNDSMDRPPTHADSLALLLELTRRSDSVPRLPVSILRIVDGDQRVVVALAQRHRSLRLEFRPRAGALGLRTPEWEFPDAMEITVGEPWRFRWQWFPGRIELSSGPVSAATPAIHTTIPISIGLGWAFLHPFVHAINTSAPVWTALWLAWWFGLLGWFAGAVGAREALGYGCSGILVLFAASRLTGIPIIGLELVAPLTSLLLFVVLSRWVNGTTRRDPQAVRA